MGVMYVGVGLGAEAGLGLSNDFKVTGNNV